MLRGDVADPQPFIKRLPERHATASSIEQISGHWNETRLIKDGATLIENARDVVNLLNQQRLEESELPIFAPAASYKVDENQVDRARAALLDGLAPTPTPVDELIRLCDFPAPIVWAALLELELAGRILRLPGNQVALLVGISAAEAG